MAVAVPATREYCVLRTHWRIQVPGSTTRLLWTKGSCSEPRANLRRSRQYYGRGNTDVKEATRLVDICLDSGVYLFNIADLYYQVAPEEILGKAMAGRRNAVFVSTKATFPIGDGHSFGGRVRFRRKAPLECRS